MPSALAGLRSPLKGVETALLGDKPAMPACLPACSLSSGCELLPALLRACRCWQVDPKNFTRIVVGATYYIVNCGCLALCCTSICYEPFQYVDDKCLYPFRRWWRERADGLIRAWCCCCLRSDNFVRMYDIDTGVEKLVVSTEVSQTFSAPPHLDPCAVA